MFCLCVSNNTTAKPPMPAATNSPQADVPRAIQSAYAAPIAKTIHATRCRAAGATKYAEEIMSAAAKAEKKRMSQASSVSNHGATHIPETIWSAGQNDSATEWAMMPANSAANHAAIQTTGSNIQRK